MTSAALRRQSVSPRTAKLNPLEAAIVRHVALVGGMTPAEIEAALQKGRAAYQFRADWAEAMQMEWERRNPVAAAELAALEEDERASDMGAGSES